MNVDELTIPMSSALSLGTSAESSATLTLDDVLTGIKARGTFRALKGAKIYTIADSVYQELQRLPGVKQTSLKQGSHVELHSHSFPAWYFTFNVTDLRTGSERVQLPSYAAVLVEAGTEHSWWNTGNDKGTIIYFHPGHGAHKIGKNY